MKYISVLATIIYSILFLNSCISVKTVVFDVQKPAQIIFPQEIRTLAIVNNAVPQPQGIGHTNYKYTKKGDRITEEISVPSDSVDIMFSEVLFEELSNHSNFESVRLYEHALRDDLDYVKTPIIDSVKLEQLFELLDSDAIISLDRFLIASNSEEESFDLVGEKIKFLNLKTEAIFRIYQKDKFQATPYYSADSIYWEALYTSDDKSLLSLDSIPSRENALKQGAAYVAGKIAKAFTPNWESRARIYYGDSKEANKQIESVNWSTALFIWQEAFDKEMNKKKKARLAHNMAIAYELSDNLADALKWSDTSVKILTDVADTNTDRRNLTLETNYYQELLERLNDFRLFQQLETSPI